jgi:hypothetical protein
LTGVGAQATNRQLSDYDNARDGRPKIINPEIRQMQNIIIKTLAPFFVLVCQRMQRKGGWERITTIWRRKFGHTKEAPFLGTNRGRSLSY